MRFRWIATLVVAVISACAGVPPLDTTGTGARLVFANVPGEKYQLQYFASLDGLRLKDSPKQLSVQTGNRTVGYQCTLYVDGPPPVTISMYFASGKTYVFHCISERQAWVSITHE